VLAKRANAPANPDNPRFLAVPDKPGGNYEIRAGLMLKRCWWSNSAGRGAGPGFQGGLRGSLRIRAAFVPGVEVTLDHAQTNISRIDVTTGNRGEYASQRDLALWSEGRPTGGIHRSTAEGISIGTQQFLTLDLTLRGRGDLERVTVTGQRR